MSTRAIVLTALSAATAFSALGFGPAFAQDQSDRSATVEDIVVTAERRETALQETPISVSAFSADTLEQLQINNALDLVRYVPSLVGSNNTGLSSANVYFLRGLGNTESIATFDPPVATYVDDIFVARQNANNYALFDVERIEVLRGPQGTLFGRNTTGGAISIINRRPADTFGAFAEVGYGERNQGLIRGSVDIPVNDAFLTKFSAYYTQSDGYIDNVVTGEELGGNEAWGVRGAVTLIPNSAVEWNLAADYTFQDQINLPGLGIAAGFTRTPSVPWTTATRLRESDDCADGVISRAYSETAATGRPQTGLCNTTAAWSVTSHFDIDLGGANLSFITGYRDLEQNFNVDFFNGGYNAVSGINPATPTSNGFLILNEGEHTQFSQEIKLAGSLFGDQLDYVAGAFYFEEDNTTRIVDYLFPGSAIAFRSITDRILENTTESYALYAQGDWNFTDQFSLTLGLRWTYEGKEIGYVVPTDVASAPGSLIGGNLLRTGATTNAAPLTGQVATTADLVTAGIPRESEVWRVTPRIGLNYQVNDDVLLFASYTEGFKSGGWNARETNPTRILPFRPEFANTIEAGIKADWLDGRLRTNVTLYASTIDNLQVVTGLVDPSTGGLIFLNQNAADMRVDGLEAEIQARPTSDLDLFANLTLTNARYTRVLDPSGRITRATEPVRTPDLQLSIGGRWWLPISGPGDFYVQADATHTSRYWVATNNGFSGLNALTEPTTLLNAGVGYESENGRWSGVVECSNCTEEDYVVSWLNFYYYNTPREVMARLRFNY